MNEPREPSESVVRPEPLRREDVEQRLCEVLEKLAAIEHERWAHWQIYLHNKCVPQPDGSLLIPKDLAQRWARQSSTPYSHLCDEERESDKEQARKYLPTIVQALVEQRG